MDLREIIKWFIPCFHILLKLDARMIFIWLLLFCSLSPGSAASVSDLEKKINSTKNLVSYENNSKLNQSEVYGSKSLVTEEFSNEDTSIGRTFGRPMKKMMQALIPMAVAIGSAGTWAVVAALIGAKTLVVTLFILKLLLMAGAAKAVELVEAGFRNRQAYYNHNPGYQTAPTQAYNAYQKPSEPIQPKPVIPPVMFGGLLGSKLHHQPHYAPPPHYSPPPSKEIHLHIHNGQHGHHDHDEEVIPNLSSWSRDSPASSPASISSKVSADPYNPYLYLASGPQTIRTPYGNYVKVD